MHTLTTILIEDICRLLLFRTPKAHSKCKFFCFFLSLRACVCHEWVLEGLDGNFSLFHSSVECIFSLFQFFFPPSIGFKGKTDRFIQTLFLVELLFGSFHFLLFLYVSFADLVF